MKKDPSVLFLTKGSNRRKCILFVGNVVSVFQIEKGKPNRTGIIVDPRPLDASARFSPHIDNLVSLEVGKMPAWRKLIHGFAINHNLLHFPFCFNKNGNFTGLTSGTALDFHRLLVTVLLVFSYYRLFRQEPLTFSGKTLPGRFPARLTLTLRQCLNLRISGIPEETSGSKTSCRIPCTGLLRQRSFSFWLPSWFPPFCFVRSSTIRTISCANAIANPFHIFMKNTFPQ